MKYRYSKKNGILDNNSIMPVDFLLRLMDVLASLREIHWPFMDYMGTLVDDLKEYFIRECQECWRIYSVNCKCLNLGITCENY